MPDRYGDPDGDGDTMRLDLDLEELAEITRRRRVNLTSRRSSRSSREAREAMRRERVEGQLSESERRAAGIAGCGMCDGDGYTAAMMVCDHVDRTVTYARGRYLIRATMGWERPIGDPTTPPTAPHSDVQGRTVPPDSNPTPQGCRDAPGRAS